MNRNREKTTAQTRRAARGNVPGFLGMAELSKLTGKPDAVSRLCTVCCKPLSPGVRIDAKTCSDACRAKSSRNGINAMLEAKR